MVGIGIPMVKALFPVREVRFAKHLAMLPIVTAVLFNRRTRSYDRITRFAESRNKSFKLPCSFFGYFSARSDRRGGVFDSPVKLFKVSYAFSG